MISAFLIGGLLFAGGYVVTALVKRGACTLVTAVEVFGAADGIIGASRILVRAVLPSGKFVEMPGSNELRFELVVGAVALCWVSVLVIASAFRQALGMGTTVQAKASLRTPPPEGNP
jgi:hypothetical protein